MNVDEHAFVDAVPNSDRWVVMDFVQQVGDSRNRYAEEKHRMIAKAKWHTSQYWMKEKDVAEVFEDLRSAPENTWTSGK